MQTHNHPLEPFFFRAVCNVYEGKLGIYDPEIIAYVAKLLSEFSHVENLYKLHGADGQPLDTLEEMIEASDPVHGTAASFDAERAVRKHIGDYALFVAGMYTDERPSARRGGRPNFQELIETGKQSYHIVSQFNLFEYEQEAPLFARLADRFEQFVLGLKLVRDEMDAAKSDLLPAAGEQAA